MCCFFPVTSILVDSETLKEAISALKDGSEVVVERLEKQEYLHKGQLLLELRGWNPNTWYFSPSSPSFLPSYSVSSPLPVSSYPSTLSSSLPPTYECTRELTESKEIIVDKTATVDDILTLVSKQENIEVRDG